jgi:hypothetical protein
VATYSVWNKARPVRRVTWVCGPEPVLAREVVDAHLRGAPPDQCGTLFAGDMPERELWDRVLADPPLGGRRIVVYGAEKLREPENVALAVGPDVADSAYAVFVSAAGDFEREDGALVPHLAALQASRAGQLIRCCAPSSADARAELVASWWPGSSVVTGQDVLMKSGSLEKSWLACEKARRAGLSPSTVTVAAVCIAEPSGQLADLLMAGTKHRAMAAARRLTREELGAVIGLLAHRLLVAELIADGVKSGMTPREAVADKRVDRFVASRVLPYLPSYTDARIRSCRAVLAGAETAWRNGVSAGVAESLVALW